MIAAVGPLAAVRPWRCTGSPEVPRGARGCVLRGTALCALMAATLAAASPALAQTYRVDPSLTTATFSVSYLGVAKQHGRFDRVSGRIVLDPAARSGSIDVLLDSASISTGWALRDDFLRGEHMVDVERYPWFRFRSRRLVYGDDGLVGVDGEVTLHGVTRPVRLYVRRLSCSRNAVRGHEGCGAQIVGRISRSAFGMDYAYPLVGDDVELDLAVTAIRD